MRHGNPFWTPGATYGVNGGSAKWKRMANLKGASGNGSDKEVACTSDNLSQVLHAMTACAMFYRSS